MVVKGDFLDGIENLLTDSYSLIKSIWEETLKNRFDIYYNPKG